MSTPNEVPPSVGSLVLVHGVCTYFGVFQSTPSTWVECQLRGYVESGARRKGGCLVLKELPLVEENGSTCCGCSVNGADLMVGTQVLETKITTTLCNAGVRREAEELLEARAQGMKIKRSLEVSAILSIRIKDRQPGRTKVHGGFQYNAALRAIRPAWHKAKEEPRPMRAECSLRQCQAQCFASVAPLILTATPRG